MMRLYLSRGARATVLLTCMLALASKSFGQGAYAPAVGAINRSMGSAAVAAPLDGIGAINWNPASLSGLQSSEMSFSIELLIPNIEVSSFVPGVGSGTTDSDSGVMPLPNIAWVHQSPDPRLTVGLGVSSVAGFQTNYPADPTNPILAPQRSPATAPLGGFGQVFSEATYIDIAPTLAYKFTDRLTIGVAPVATMAKLHIEPMVFAGVNDANGDGVATYPRGHGTRYSWGGGMNLGLYYEHDCNWRFGASVKTPRWIESFRYNTADEVGLPISARANYDLPLVVSVGGSYGGLKNTLLALDVRYIDYENADGFGDTGLAADGSLNGLGWRSVVAVATGLQHRLTDKTTARIGYLYNENPIPNAQTQFSIAAPLHYQHTIGTGLSFQPYKSLMLNVSYAYATNTSITGPITLPPNPPTSTPPFTVPGSSVTSSVDAHAIDFGVLVRY